jgi:rod shape determining protein RodA
MTETEFFGLIKFRFGRWKANLRVDPSLSVALFLLAVTGLITLYSATSGDLKMVGQQAARMVLGAVVLLLLSRTPPHVLRRWAPWLYAVALLLLAICLVIGEGRGAHRWLNLRVVRFQPSELMKLALPMMLAAYFHPRALPPNWRDLFIAMVMMVIPVLLVAKQPDLGTAILIGSAGAFVIFLSGLSWWRIAGFATAIGAAIPVLWNHLHEYQRNRIRVLFDPEADPLGNGWHIIQSKIAVGSGGLWGKGLMHGSQSQLEFLPERHTDFIFAVFSEEFGWVGVACLLALYLFIIYRSLRIAMDARDTFGRLLAGAIGLSFFVYVIVNGGMVAGALPVVGVPLPLISYGGTSAVSLLAGFGMLMSVHAHRKINPTKR